MRPIMSESSSTAPSSSRTTANASPARVALARQQPRQPPGRGGVVDAAQRPQLLADQGARGLLLVGRVEVVERRAGGLVVDALAPQLLGQRPAGQPAAALPALHPGPREGLVVDQPDLGEPVEQPLGELGGHVALGQLVAQLLAAAGLAGQGVEQDRARHRLRRRRRARRPPGRVAATGVHGSPPVQAATPAATSPCQPTPGWRRGAADGVRSHRRRSARRTGRRRRPARRRSGRPRASPGSASPARWPGRGCR